MSDALTSRAAREYRDERDRQERTKGGPRLAMLHSAPPPQSEGDYGEQAPSAPFDEVAPEGGANPSNCPSSRLPHSRGAIRRRGHGSCGI